jgi:hypothetical protein
LKGPDDWKSIQSPNVDEEICGVLSWQGQLEVNQTLREPGIVMVIGIKRVYGVFEYCLGSLGT